MSALSASLQSFFTTYLLGQRAASPHTIAAYRDTWRMLLIHVHAQTGICPADIDICDLHADVITGFLQHLEDTRGNSVRTRNARLAAIHAFFSYASYRHPEHLDLIARVLAIQTKRTTTTILTYLSDAEVEALLDAPNQNTRTGRRDHAIMATLIATGLRVGELTGLTHHDLTLPKPAHLVVHGKGRKDRITPLNTATVTTCGGGKPRTPATPKTARYSVPKEAPSLSASTRSLPGSTSTSPRHQRPARR